MNDMKNRFRNLDTLRAPDLWHDAQARAAAAAPVRSGPSWILIAGALMLALLIGGAALVGAGIVKLPSFVDNSATPRPRASQVPVAGWTAGGSLPGAQVGTSGLSETVTATLLRTGQMLVVGGSNWRRADLFDPTTGTWTETDDMVHPRGAPAAVLLADGRVLVVGGWSGTDLSAASTATAEIYDPASRKWVGARNMLTARSDPTATLLQDGRVLVAGGQSISPADPNGSWVASAEIFDPAAGSWSAAGDMLVPVPFRTATLLRNGQVLFAGGVDTTNGMIGGRSAELFDPVARTWTATPDMISRHVEHTATLLPGGQVLIVGGFPELYDPHSNSWTPTAAMPTTLRLFPEGFVYSSATLMPDGRVLVAGGADEFCCVPVPVATAELYDPTTGSWTVTEPMQMPRIMHVAVLLPDGRVMVMGGGTCTLHHNDGGGSSCMMSPLLSIEFYTPNRR